MGLNTQFVLEMEVRQARLGFILKLLSHIGGIFPLNRKCCISVVILCVRVTYWLSLPVCFTVGLRHCKRC